MVPTDEARRIAYGKGLDLVEISPHASPPVCRILDYGKYKYQLKKQQHETKKKQHIIVVKELKVRPRTGEHDLKVKINHAREFIQRGDKTVVTMFFKGRELAHMEIGRAAMERFARELEDVAKSERPITRDGPRLFMVLAPK